MWLMMLGSAQRGVCKYGCVIERLELIKRLRVSDLARGKYTVRIR